MIELTEIERLLTPTEAEVRKADRIFRVPVTTTDANGTRYAAGAIEYMWAIEILRRAEVHGYISSGTTQ